MTFRQMPKQTQVSYYAVFNVGADVCDEFVHRLTPILIHVLLYVFLCLVLVLRYGS